MASHSKHKVMFLTYKTMTLLGSIMLTGLSAGLFYAWSVSVIPGTLKVPDMAYLQTMQSINKAILNPGFFLIFFGSLFLLLLASINEFKSNQVSFSLVLIALVSYLIGTLGITAFGNVPLNNQLETLDLTSISSVEAHQFRQSYETKWNRLNHIRAGFSILSFLFATLALLTQITKQ